MADVDQISDWLRQHGLDPDRVASVEIDVASTRTCADARLKGPGMWVNVYEPDAEGRSRKLNAEGDAPLLSRRWVALAALPFTQLEI